jgi:hypothetical protein
MTGAVAQDVLFNWCDSDITVTPMQPMTGREQIEQQGQPPEDM